MSSTRRSLLIGGAAVVAAAGGYLAYSQKLIDLPGAGKETAALPLPRPPLLGDVNAPKRFVVWGSYTCPFTAMLIPGLMKIVKDMPSLVSLEWRHLPTHAPDPALHVAGLGFQGEHFWNFTSAILGFIYASGGPFDGLTPEKILEFAQAEGATQADLDKSYADKAKWVVVKEDFLAGHLLGVKMTPGLFFNGYFLTPNGVPRDLAAFDKSLREMIVQG